MGTLLGHWQPLLLSVALLVGAVLVALVGHYAVFVLAKGVSRRTGSIIEDSSCDTGNGPPDGSSLFSRSFWSYPCFRSGLMCCERCSTRWASA